MDLENDYYLVKFKGEVDYVKALKEGPWHLCGFPQKIIVWIRLLRLLEVVYKKSILTTIRNTVGWVIKIDYKIDNKFGGQFACMVIILGLKRPLVSNIWIDGTLQRLEYEGLLNVYFLYRKYGHLQELRPERGANSCDHEASNKKVPLTLNLDQRVKSGRFEGWIIMRNKQRRKTKILVE
ncbi:hypothetical protein Goshw_007258 [Gossypium schwendimanii]|uniref:DUF4283 domain-containing protein n=1 Tax=Gossypium schwendimanii TaxID=34291 RepID=A0A7J9N9V0_GOSSC|nr:hypothetical protein [Gossypium schwendimanii]